MNEPNHIIASLVRIFILFLFLIAPQRLDAQVRDIPAKVTPEIEGMLCELDSLLKRAPEFINEKEAHLRHLRENLQNTTNLERRYWLLSELYNEFCAYDSDSAMVYAHKARDLARELGREDLVHDMDLNLTYILSATGFIEEADKILSGIDPHSLPQDLKLKYCESALFLATHRNQYIGNQSAERLYPQYVDSLMQTVVLTPSDPNYCWLIGWQCLSDPAKAAKALPIVSEIVNSEDNNTRGSAMNSWVLAKLYESIGDNQQRLKYLIYSAMADVRASIKEIASLEEVAASLYGLGELDRANIYLNYCISSANDYKSRVRTGNLAELQKHILLGIQKRSDEQIRANKTYLWLLLAILLVLVLAILYIWRQNKLLRNSRLTLNKANAELHDKVAELSEIRRQLNESNEKLSGMYESAKGSARELAEINEATEAHIANMFTICSNYINKIDEFRANLHRLLADRNFEQVMRIVKSPELSYEEVKELYETFDEIFLKIYPDFVADFNTLLRPEERITLKNPNKLTTELRIYALVRLGLNDSVKIAKFLHCSVQTVYNTRQRTRNKALNSDEKFAEAVKRLGKLSF